MEQVDTDINPTDNSQMTIHDSSKLTNLLPEKNYSPKVTTQSEPTIVGVAFPVKNRQQPAPDPDKCESVDR